MLWIKNTDGKKDAVLTMTFMGFLVVLVKVLFAGAVFDLGVRTVSVGTIDAAAIAAILTPTLGAYVMRKYTDQKYAPMDTNHNGKIDPEEEAEAQKEG
jgi:hypothetical protein